MLESNFIAFLKSCFPDIPVYSFYIPEDAPSPAFCFENAGSGIHQLYTDGSEITSRTVKLTLSSTNIKDIYDDKNVHKYIREASQLGELQIISARITNFSDAFISEQKIFERTYTINFKFKGKL